CGSGPATARGLGQARRVAVEGASRLEALAGGLAAVGRDELLVPVVDARRGEVFAAAYRAGGPGGLTEVVAPAAFAPADLLAAVGDVADRPALAAGDGLAALPPAADGPLRAAAGERIHRVRAAGLARGARAAGPVRSRRSTGGCRTPRSTGSGGSAPHDHGALARPPGPAGGDPPDAPGRRGAGARDRAQKSRHAVERVDVRERAGPAGRHRADRDRPGPGGRLRDGRPPGRG